MADCDPNEITCPDTQPPDEGSLADTITDTVIEVADSVLPDEAVGAVAGAAVDAAASAAVEALDKSLEDRAAASIERFQEQLADSLIITEDILDNPLTAPFQGTIGMIAFTAVAVTLLGALAYGARHLRQLAGPFVTYLMVLSAGSLVIGSLVLISDQYLAATVAVDLGDPNVEGAGQAAIAAPFVLGAVTVVMGARTVILGIMALVWVFSAAVHLFSAARSAFALASALLLANVAWPVLVMVFINDAFAALPWIGETITWLVLALLTPIGVNAFAAAVVRRSTTT